MKQATRILFNGNILTMDTFNSAFPAIALQGKRILALGSNAEMLALAGTETETTDLKGKTVIPGFCDAHGHFLMAAEFQTRVNLNSPPIGKCRTFADCMQLLRERVAITPAGQWVQAYGFDDTLIAEGRFPNRHELDAVSAVHPIFINHISGHLAILNSLGLEKLHYTKDTPDPAGGVIRREADNSPDGVLEESAVVQAWQLLPELSPEEMIASIERLGREYLSKGVTSALDAGVMRQQYITFLHEAARQNKLPVRVTYNPFYIMYDAMEENTTATPLLHKGGIKFLQDGSIQGFTAYLSQPYHTAFKNNAQWKGYPTFTRDELFQHISRHHKLGRQCIVHTNGDAASEDALDAFEAAQKEYPVADPRFMLVHAQTIREDQLDRCKKLGVTLTFFTLHAYYWGDRHRDVFLGPERAFRQNPMRSALNRGLVVTSHCDIPVVPLTPFLSIWACVNRLSSSGAVMGPEQRISVIEALRAHTINAAWQNFQDHEKGSLEVGKYADMAVLDTDPFACPPEALRDIGVTMTLLDGKTVFTQ